MGTRVSFTWSTRRDGNDGYVLEEYTDKYGDVVRRTETKMPAHLVPAYCEARRRVVAMAAEQNDASYVDAEVDYTYMLDKGLIQ